MIEDGVGLSNGLLIALGVVLVFLLGLSAGLQAQDSLSSWFPSKGVKSNVYKGHADEKHAVSKADTLDLSDIASSQVGSIPTCGAAFLVFPDIVAASKAYSSHHGWE